MKLKAIWVPAICLLLAWGMVSAEEQVTIVHCGTLLAVPGEDPLAKQSLVLRGDRIDSVRAGFLTAEALGEPAEILDLSERFVMPGLIDLHVHLQLELGPERKVHQVTRSEAQWTLVALEHARRTLRAGFTTVRDLGGNPNVLFALRDASANGEMLLPRIVAAGNFVAATGGHGDVHGFIDPILELIAGDGVCDGADDCRRAVRAQVKRGSDVIKVTATGGVLSETAAGTNQQLFRDELEAIVSTAHRLERRVAAHAHGVDGIKAALRAGVDTIEHGSFSDDEAFDLFKQEGATLVPTLLAGAMVVQIAENSGMFPAEIREKALDVGPRMMETLRRANQAGVTIGFGTDSGVSRHGDNAQEFPLMVEAGMTPGEILVSATITAARALGLEEEIGTLEAGKAADLIAVSGSPLEEIGLLLEPPVVIRAGQVVD